MMEGKKEALPKVESQSEHNETQDLIDGQQVSNRVEVQAATDRGNSNRDYMIPVIDPNKAREDKQKLAESRYMSSFSQILKEISAEDNENSQIK